MTVKMPQGQTLPLHGVNGGCTVKQIKGLIKGEQGIPRKEQRLLFKNDQLEDSRTLRGYNIHDGDELTWLLRLGGGGKRGGHPELRKTSISQKLIGLKWKSMRCLS